MHVRATPQTRTLEQELGYGESLKSGHHRKANCAKQKESTIEVKLQEKPENFVFLGSSVTNIDSTQNVNILFTLKFRVISLSLSVYLSIYLSTYLNGKDWIWVTEQDVFYALTTSKSIAEDKTN